VKTWQQVSKRINCFTFTTINHHDGVWWVGIGGCGELFVICSCFDSKILLGCHLDLCSEFSEEMAAG
jgi:hypothetical protein